MKVFIFDPLWSKLVDERLEKQLAESKADITVVTEIKPLSETTELFAGNEERLLCLNPDYIGWKLTDKDYENIPNLKAILVASTAFGYIEQGVANKRGIPICNIKNFSTQAVAEWAITMMLNLARQTPRLTKDGFPLDFDADFMKYRGVQIKGKTAGVIGLGHNGSAIAERCAGLGMNVTYWSRSSTNDNYKRVELDELFSTSDVIFPAYAKNDETNALITDKLLASVKPSAMIVDIIELEEKMTEIIDMVKAGKLFGYGFEAKPATFNKYEGNVWAAPAYGWVTYESMYNSEVKLVENIVSASKAEFPNKVN
ncbi:MAG TPA: NAD(P)-dependent oxidoreductase [Candidatus Saccharimonadales bacterium]|nr:NAD(P)-dependent oxidoreductase [Candidatus Saccharimonadales bacterium]